MIQCQIKINSYSIFEPILTIAIYMHTNLGKVLFVAGAVASADGRHNIIVDFTDLLTAVSDN